MSDLSPGGVQLRLNQRLSEEKLGGSRVDGMDEDPVNTVITAELESLVGKAISNLSSEELTVRIERALDLARRSGPDIPVTDSPNCSEEDWAQKCRQLHESAQHRSWVIDNIVRELTGPYYDSFVKVACCGERCDEDGNVVVPYVIELDSYEWYVGKEALNHNTVNAPSVELKPTSVNDLKERIVSAAITGAFGQGTADHHLAKRIDDIVLTLADTQYAAAIRDQPQWYKGIQA